MKNGMVFLVGAGPGDPRLLTVGAMQCLKRADVVVYDHLADESILSYVPETAERIYVGKQSCHHTMRQEEINVLLADKAEEGKTVVRLKGGDPFVFGRGGEEALVLLERGVPFEILPGVTSAISVPAYAGIPVTHRGVAVSFAVVTGHEDPTKPESHVRWQHLATGVDTLIFLMGVANLPEITKNLIENGRPADTPAALIRWGTRADQEMYVTTVGEAAEMVRRDGIRPPAIFIVGDVVRLRDRLRTYGIEADLVPQEFRAEAVVDALRPILPPRAHILLPRAQEARDVLPASLSAHGATVDVVAAYETVPETEHGEELAAQMMDGAFDYVTFTSSSTVKNLVRMLGNITPLQHTKIACIGPVTAETVKSYALMPAMTAMTYTIDGLVDCIRESVE